MHVYERQIPDPREMSIRQIPGGVPAGGGIVTPGIDSCIKPIFHQLDSPTSGKWALIHIFCLKFSRSGQSLILKLCFIIYMCFSNSLIIHDRNSKEMHINSVFRNKRKITAVFRQL